MHDAVLFISTEKEDIDISTGFMSPEEIRSEMEKSDIFLFTSDHKEGWGADYHPTDKAYTNAAKFMLPKIKELLK